MKMLLTNRAQKTEMLKFWKRMFTIITLINKQSSLKQM